MGPTAIPKSYCGLHQEEEPVWRASGTYGWLRSTLRFTGDVEADFWQQTATAAMTRRLGDAFTIQAGAGVLIGGSLEAGGATYRIEPGWIVQAGATWMALDGRRGGPFLAVTATLAASGAHTTSAGVPSATLTAVDLGLSGSLGMAFFGWLAPYLGVKVFGGPVFWTLAGAGVTGTDVHHYQVALGAAVVLPGGFDLLVEGAPLGEQSVSASLGFAF